MLKLQYTLNYENYHVPLHAMNPVELFNDFTDCGNAYNNTFY